MQTPWYIVTNADAIPSPALLVYPDRVEDNIRRMIRIAGGVERLRPHLKTNKLPEVVRDGQTGALCAVGDVEGMAAAATRLLTDHALWQSMSARAAADSRARFSLDQVVAQYEAFYLDVLGDSLPADDE